MLENIIKGLSIWEQHELLSESLPAVLPVSHFVSSLPDPYATGNFLLLVLQCLYFAVPFDILAALVLINAKIYHPDSSLCWVMGSE